MVCPNGLPLMEMSRLRLGYPRVRPIVAVPGTLLTIAAQIFLMLVAGPQKELGPTPL